MDYIPDYNELHADYEAQQERIRKKLPKCDCCDERILDDNLWDIEGTIYCERCIDNCRKYVDEYMC